MTAELLAPLCLIALAGVLWLSRAAVRRFEAAVEYAALRRASAALLRTAASEFEAHGFHSGRGAGIWDAACAINPDDGDLLGIKDAS